VRAASPASFERLQATAAPAWRTLQYFALSRVLVASALLLSLAAFGGAATPFGVTGPQAAPLLLAGSVTYFGLSAVLAVAAFYLRQRFLAQVVGQLAVDLVLITALVVGGGGLRAGIIVLYLLPLAGASLLLPTSAAFFVCAVAVLSLLADAALRAIGGTSSDSLLFQTGLFGAALFAITGLLRLLSARLAEQERLAQLRGQDLENQLEINRLVIAQMEQGVLVVDASTRVRANNLAARLLLGLPPAMQLTGRRLSEFGSLQPLSEAFMRWRAAERSSGVWSNTVMQPSAPAKGDAGKGEPDPLATQLELRARFARPPSDTGDEFVIFLEDVRAVEERAQQLKLAAMGRLTASIAHEIRNPLAAISHAGQLLAEDSSEPLQQRLAGIVRENTQRLNRLVDDVLRVARREAPLGDSIELDPFVRNWLEEFVRDRSLAPGRVVVTAEPKVVVKFELSHLRQVLFNLVDNGLRYASDKVGAVEIVVERALDDGGRVRLWVFDDGPGVPADTRTALFEPFYTTHARGTGLGLYIAREFCVANRCELSFGSRRNFDGSSREGFVLRFARSAGGAAEDVGFLDTIPVQ
jgi:two-component system sensor histidine kinase PilS (NtrC family)